jgi:DNA-directed RNA polymerases I, II, and III subunit RPABC3
VCRAAISFKTINLLKIILLINQKYLPLGTMAGAGGDATLFEETFTVTNYDQSKYDRVARISATSTDNQTVMQLDINIELFPCAVSDSLHVVLATSLALDGGKEEDKGWRDPSKGVSPNEPTIADMFEYVCHGKIYKFEDGDDGQIM